MSSCMEIIVLYSTSISFIQRKLVTAYIQALSFRSGHYFVSYCSQLTSLLSLNYHFEKDLGVTSVTHFSEIEYPRSLVDVCQSWNIPMSFWLKKYVFAQSKLYLGTFAGLIITYLISSLLHGFNFRISAILLSLAFYTYVEFVLRRLLSKRFSACVEAKECPESCQHTFGKKNWIVKIVNTSFALLAIFHLAYLGAPFGLNLDDDSDTTNNNITLQLTVRRWSQLGFLSPIIVLLTFLSSFLLKLF
ncbi:unnamed protein product [Gordionus sp. m RMFG-2023]